MSQLERVNYQPHDIDLTAVKGLTSDHAIVFVFLLRPTGTVFSEQFSFSGTFKSTEINTLYTCPQHLLAMQAVQNGLRMTLCAEKNKPFATYFDPPRPELLSPKPVQPSSIVRGREGLEADLLQFQDKPLLMQLTQTLIDQNIDLDTYCQNKGTDPVAFKQVLTHYVDYCRAPYIRSEQQALALLDFTRGTYLDTDVYTTSIDHVFRAIHYKLAGLCYDYHHHKTPISKNELTTLQSKYYAFLGQELPYFARLSNQELLIPMMEIAGYLFDEGTNRSGLTTALSAVFTGHLGHSKIDHVDLRHYLFPGRATDKASLLSKSHYDAAMLRHVFGQRTTESWVVKDIIQGLPEGLKFQNLSIFEHSTMHCRDVVTVLNKTTPIGTINIPTILTSDYDKRSSGLLPGLARVRVLQFSGDVPLRFFLDLIENYRPHELNAGEVNLSHLTLAQVAALKLPENHEMGTLRIHNQFFQPGVQEALIAKLNPATTCIKSETHPFHSWMHRPAEVAS